MLTPGEIWPMLAAAGVVVFGAGQLVARIQNGKHVSKEFCTKQHQLTDQRYQNMQVSLEEIKGGMHDIKAWINKDGVA